MIVRDATFTDLEHLRPLFREAHRCSRFRDMEMNEAAMQRNFVTAVQFDDGFAKVATNVGAVVGGMFAIIGDNHYGIRCAQDLFCYSRGGTDKLIRAYKAWARDRGALFAQITDLSGNSEYHKLITGLGFKPAGTNFVKVA
jgi:hypothetical protein